MSYRIVIIEDQRLFRDLLRSLLDSHEELEVVGTAASAADGLDLCERMRPDVALIDIDLPDRSGCSLAATLKENLEDLAMLAVTALTDPVTTTRVFESGFSGYVEKDQTPEVVIEAVLTVAEGAHYFTQLVRENRKRIFTDPDAINKILSRREREIIGWVCTGRTSREIAEQMNLSARTVENHRHRIIRKLAVDGAAGLIEFGRKLGFDRYPEL